MRRKLKFAVIKVSQLLQDFGKPAMHRAHTENPPADVSTSLKTYQKYTLDNFYQGNNFFWSLLPQPNDWVLFELHKPVRIECWIDF